MHIAWGRNKTAKLQVHNHKGFENFCGSVVASCKPGNKQDAIYFIRGGELKELHRNDANLLSAELIVGDVDNTDIPPDIAHKLLKAHCLTHLIYTTSSYTPEAPKYRVILPYTTANKEECRRATAYLNSVLPEIELAPESYVWSQEWFISVADETGSWFYEGSQLEIPADFQYKGKDNKIDSPPATAGDQSYETHIAEMMRTGDGHNHYGPMCLALVNKGMKAKDIFNTIQPMAKTAMAIHGRIWEKDRDENLWACITSAVQKVEREKPKLPTAIIPNIHTKKIKHSDDYPPGLMGQLVREFEQMSYYPDKHISMAGAITFIAGIIGRSYNINRMGLNLYTTVLMDTGRGKDFLNKVITRALLGASPGGNAGRSFIGSTRYTGPKAVWNDFEEGLCKISVMTEAGIMNGSKAGDKENLERALLNLYTSSGLGSYIIGERYSSNKDSLPTLHSPALSILQESTPEVFIKNMLSNEGDIRGDLARMWIVRVVGDKPVINRSRLEEFSPVLKDRVVELVTECSKNQKEMLELSGDYVPTDHMYDISDKYTKKENEARKSGEHLKMIMATRAFAKALKIAAIIDIFNGSNLCDETFDWVCKHLIDIELVNISITFQYESSDDIMEIAINVAAPIISKILNNKYNDLKKVPIKELRDKGIFTRGNLYQCLKNNKVLKELHTKKGGYKAKHGIDILLEYMVDHGLLYKLDEKALLLNGAPAAWNFGVGYKITNELLEIVS